MKKKKTTTLTPRDARNIAMEECGRAFYFDKKPDWIKTEACVIVRLSKTEGGILHQDGTLALSYDNRELKECEGNRWEALIWLDSGKASVVLESARAKAEYDDIVAMQEMMEKLQA